MADFIVSCKKCRGVRLDASLLKRFYKDKDFCIYHKIVLHRRTCINFSVYSLMDRIAQINGSPVYWDFFVVNLYFQKG